MASVEIDGFKLTFKNGRCSCKNPDWRELAQGLMDRYPDYYGNAHNFAVEELVKLGGTNPVLDQEFPSDDILH